MRWPFVLFACDASDPGSIIAGFILFVILIFVYFIPTVVANANRKVNTSAIFVLNLLLGWTLVGWVIALVWALAKEDKDLRQNRPY